MRLYFGNLADGIDDSKLGELVEEFGQIESAAVITDRDTGRSRGFGFVEMGNEEEARAAITGLDGREVDGKALKVNEARPRREGSQGKSRF